MTLISILNGLGFVFLVSFFLYLLFWRTKSVGDVLTQDKEASAIYSFSRSCDKYSWLLLVLGIGCLIVAEYLSGNGSFVSILKEYIIGS